MESTFGRVGDAAKGMETDVGSASRGVRDSAGSFDRAGEAADAMDTKAMGFRDTMTGVEDTSLGVSKIMKGDLFDGFLTLGMGIGDLGSGLYNFLIPAMKSMSLSMIAQGKAFVVTKVHMAAHTAGVVVGTVAGKAARLATTAWTVAQWALNAAMRANPIGIVITAITLLGGALVLAWKKSSTFRAIVTGAFNAVKAVATGVWNAIKSGAQALGRVFSGVARAISGPFRGAFQGIKNAWNSTVGGKGFSIPSWVPKIGGKEFRIPRLHGGGIVPGAPGSETMALLQAGERVTPAGRSGGATVIEIRSGGSRMDDLLVELLRRSIRVKGGNVQVVLGTS